MDSHSSGGEPKGGGANQNTDEQVQVTGPRVAGPPHWQLARVSQSETRTSPHQFFPVETAIPFAVLSSFDPGEREV